ncbi:MAG: DUF1653 domain-containing protein [Patescibacteria group bacterium]|jgi:hypothetical protein
MKVVPGKYTHYKGGQYEVIGIARHSETLEDYVAYKALYNSKKFGSNALWIRPLSMFIDEVQIDGKMVHRFVPEI